MQTIYDIYFSLFETTTLVISFMYVVIKLREYLLNKKIMPSFHKWFVPLTAGLLSLLSMIHSVNYNGNVFDLRGVPLFYVSYILGWQYGILSSLLPTIYRIYLGGPTLLSGLFVSILLPIVIGGIFYKKAKVNHSSIVIGVKKILFVFLLYSILKGILGYLLIEIPFVFYMHYIANQALISAFILFIITIMINDSNKKYIAESNLMYLSYHDSMTDLPNRRLFFSEVNKLINDKIPLALIMIDIDYFKNYNDSHGHIAGGYLIKEISKVFRDNLRDMQDYIARYGGEEFVIAIPGIKLERGFAIAERIRESVYHYPFRDKETQPNQKITVSLGMSFSFGDKPLSQLLNEADTALYHSKSSGRNKTTIYNETMK